MHDKLHAIFNQFLTINYIYFSIVVFAFSIKKLKCFPIRTKNKRMKKKKFSMEQKQGKTEFYAMRVGSICSQMWTPEIGQYKISQLITHFYSFGLVSFSVFVRCYEFLYTLIRFTKMEKKNRISIDKWSRKKRNKEHIDTMKTINIFYSSVWIEAIHHCILNGKW